MTDSWLNLTKKGDVYILTEEMGSGITNWKEEFNKVEDALRTAKDIMDVENVEFGLRIGDL